MKSPLPLIFCLSAIALLAGCETSGVSSRIQEKAAVFAALSPEQQQNVKEGLIEIGDSSDMVYLALGKPSKIRVEDTPDGPVTIWTYSKLYNLNPAFRMTPAINSMTYAGPMISPNAGVDSGKAPSALKGGNFMGAPAGGGPQLSLDADSPALPSETLHVLIYKDRVFSIKLEN